MNNADVGAFGNPAIADSDSMRPLPLSWQEYSDRVLAEWFLLLAEEPEELRVQQFLELHPAMIPGGSGDVGPGGHHGAELGAVFRESRIKGSGRDFTPDFMWVTRSSGLLTPILIEIEKPSKRWFRKDGRPTQNFNDAHDQLNDWRAWFATDGNSRIFRDQYLLLGNAYADRALEPQFVLIYGRESEFEHGGGHANTDALNRKRSVLRQNDETFFTFDSLRPRFDHGSSMTVTMTATGPEPFAFSPVFGTGPGIVPGNLALGDVTDALGRSVMMSDDRRTYLRQRWLHWQTVARERADRRDGSWSLRPGLE